MERIILNPDYVLKPDSGRTLILSALVGRNVTVGIEDSFTCVIHPIYAMILCFVNGDDLISCAEKAAAALDVSKDLVEKFIINLLDNPNQVLLKGKDGVSSFPPLTIITNTTSNINNRYFPEMFDYESTDLCMKRHLTPSTITLMVNNICKTKCIYCYQDKSHLMDCKIPLERIKELIKESHKLNVNTFDVIGGEFFLYKHWREVLAELRKYGYNPYLSTKIPLKETDIEYLARLNVHDIQISIDTFIEEHLIDSIGVKQGYSVAIQETLRLLDRYHIPVMVHSVLTKFNNTIDDMKSIYDVLKHLNNLIDWHVVKGEETLYPKTNYKDIEIGYEQLQAIVTYLKEIQEERLVKIVYPTEIENNSGIRTVKNQDKTRNDFFDRSFCSGLFSSLYILPDGKVTICEQLYWNSHFIVGDIMKNSIEEVWNSNKAESLYYIKQDDIPSDSRCSSCIDFKRCREYRQVCYREIIKKYGTSKWYYPDINCPYT